MPFSRPAESLQDTLHVADQPEDTDASRGAGVVAIESAWGIADSSLLKASKPDHIFMPVADLQSFLLK